MAKIKGLTFTKPVKVVDFDVAEDGGNLNQRRLQAAIDWARANVNNSFSHVYRTHGTQGLASALQYAMIAAYADDVPLSGLVELCKAVTRVK